MHLYEITSQVEDVQSLMVCFVLCHKDWISWIFDSGARICYCIRTLTRSICIDDLGPKLNYGQESVVFSSGMLFLNKTQFVILEQCKGQTHI